MRAAARVLGPSLLVAALVLGCEQLTQRQGSDAGAATPSAEIDAGTVTAQGCAVEPKTGVVLCTVTSKCPSVVIDTQAMPNCGFVVRGTVVDLACACGTALCPMGVVTTCAATKELLASQTEQGVCVQLAEGRCAESAPTGSSSSGGNPACDKQCMKDCGGGAACASVCNCD